MTLRRILFGLTFSKGSPFRNRFFSSASTSAAFRYPVGKDPSSLPSALTQKLPKNPYFFIDGRPISLRYRVNSMIELCQLDKAAEISRLAVLDRDRNDSVLISNEIIGAMCGAKRYDEAIALFHYFFNESNVIPNIVSFNHIIKAHCEEHRVEEALELYHHARGFDPDHETYRILTKGLVKAGRVHEALGIVKAAYLCDSTVDSYLIRGFLDQGNHDKADQLYDRLVEGMSEELYDFNDIALVDATFVDYWFRQGNDELAMEIYSSLSLFEDAEFISATTGNTLLKILLDHGKKSEAWELFEEMINNARTYDGLLAKTFNSETINIMVNECFKLGKFTKAMETFELGASFAGCFSNIIERFCERGMMSEAEGLFEEMASHKDLVLSHEIPTFRSMITGYVKVGRVDDAQRMLKNMVDASLLKVAIHKAD
ncbi:unnamed protein product [Arabidopsis halleri]